MGLLSVLLLICFVDVIMYHKAVSSKKGSVDYSFGGERYCFRSTALERKPIMTVTVDFLIICTTKSSPQIDLL